MNPTMSIDEYKKAIGQTPTGETIKHHAPSMEATEHEIQAQIIDRLNLVKGAFFWRQNSGLIHSQYKGEERFWRAGVKGIPDIMGVWDGVAVGIEVKRPGKKQSQDQITFAARIREAGGIAIVCTDAREVMKQLEEARRLL